jgi:hypothetical protein
VGFPAGATGVVWLTGVPSGLEGPVAGVVVEFVCGFVVGVDGVEGAVLLGIEGDPSTMMYCGPWGV